MNDFTSLFPFPQYSLASLHCVASLLGDQLGVRHSIGCSRGCTVQRDCGVPVPHLRYPARTGHLCCSLCAQHRSECLVYDSSAHTNRRGNMIQVRSAFLKAVGCREAAKKQKPILSFGKKVSSTQLSKQTSGVWKRKFLSLGKESTSNLEPSDISGLPLEVQFMHIYPHWFTDTCICSSAEVFRKLCPSYASGHHIGGRRG